jgi:hypothetical protein
MSGARREIELNVRRTLPTLSLAVAIASTSLVFIARGPSAPAVAATPTPTASKSAKKDVCDATKSKWAHLQCEQFNGSAPGDEYFGRMKMSYLGINNTYKDGAISAGDYTTDPNLIRKLDFATEALQRWAAKYPDDPQLPRSYYLGIVVLRKVYIQSEQQTTWQFMQLLVHRYGSSYFGKMMKTSLARGFTEHWFALAEICPTPLPRGVMPENTPQATPSPTPAPGSPAVSIITPPCVQPSPIDTEEPAGAPSANPSPTKL